MDYLYTTLMRNPLRHCSCSFFKALLLPSRSALLLPSPSARVPELRPLFSSIIGDETASDNRSVCFLPSDLRFLHLLRQSSVVLKLVLQIYNFQRPVTADEFPDTGSDKRMKKIKTEEDEEEEPKMSPFLSMDENLLYEVLKHVDARTLATAACVSKQWYRTAQDERLWELICASHWPNLGCGNQRRRVVLAIGGFRRLYSQYLRPVFELPSSSSSSTSSSSAWPCLPPPSLTPVVPSIPLAPAKTRWGKDGVDLSLSLLTIRYFQESKQLT
ncbi:hypothetical protein F0562_027612 [Nyssa sinensis]|uniref:F-box protein GID2 n=1 Tax=Nyssa sinensis TaxID=561372 RepID=A0A5J5B592_9ASTE|nr:hypothetical protein F0562_027612 [Nyssa sinensis]